MSTLWTPSGERPVGRPDEPGGTAPPSSSPPGAPPRGAGAGVQAPEDLTEEELAAQMAELQRQLAETPAAVVVTNHCIGLFQLAALHLNQRPPNLAEARLAIDALAAVVEGVGSRLGEDETTLRDALAQLRLGYVQLSAAAADEGEGGEGPQASTP